MSIDSFAPAGDLVQGSAPASIYDIPDTSTSRGRRNGVYLLGNNDPLWDRLARDETLSIYRKKAWKDVVEQTYGHCGEYIAAFENGVLLDLLPFFLVKDPLNRKKMISTPYQGSNGGFLTKNRKVRQEMIDFIKIYGRQLGVQYTEIRSAAPIPELEEAGFIARQPLLVSVMPLISTQENWNRLSPNHRRNVKIARRNGIEIQAAREWAEMKVFYNMLAEHYKSLGVPFLGEKFFRQVWDKLVQNHHGILLMARHQGETIGGHLMLFNGSTLVSKFSATLHHERFTKLYAAYVLYWESIQLGAEMGFYAMDLGVTGEHNTGLREFKSRLGAVERPLYFYYDHLSGELPDFEKFYSSYQFARKMWKLAPRFITDPVGDYINTWLC